MNSRERLSSSIGLAQRAGKIISGGELVIKTIQSGKAQPIFLANDTGANLTRKITDKCQCHKVEASAVLNTSELSAVLGESRKVIAVADAGFPKKMRIPVN